MRTQLRSLWTAVLLPSLAALAAAQGSTTYVLDPDADFTQGCWPPCLCPLQLFDGVTGTFELTYLGTGPDFFAHYAVENVSWQIVGFGGAGMMSVTGSGTYDLGGQFALQEQLQLDLSIDGGPVEHFDSGLLLGGGDFPRIDLSVSIHGMVCFDKVFDVAAGPLTLGQNHCTSLPNSTGLATTIAAFGSETVTDNQFALVAHGAPPTTPGLFFFGPSQTQAPFGDGLLCVGGPHFRLSPPGTTNADGNALRGVDMTTAPAGGLVLPGTTWSFQFWYRDPTGGPAGFNLSDGVTVSFL